MRLIFSLLSLAGFCYGGWYAWENIPSLKEVISEKLSSPETYTLEIRYTADEIMRAQKETLLKNSEYKYLEPELLYYPYLLMNVKYTNERSTTSEGILIWGLTDGEMVTNTTLWTKTHGFEDCLLTHASKNDFKILKALVEKGGGIDREKLYHYFKIDADIVDEWIESCREKKLIVISGNKFRLHFENPRFEVLPLTSFEQPLVKQPIKLVAKVKKRYTIAQIQKLTQIAFGNDFAIRKTQEIYLPVYSIGIHNPDGSTRTVSFNALNGKMLIPG